MWGDKETGVNYLFHASGYADGFKPGVSSHKRQKAKETYLHYFRGLL
ncbi:DUF6440 family protein [Fusicatenibacter sp.]